MVHVLLSMDKPVGKEGAVLQAEAEVNSVMCVVRKVKDVSAKEGDETILFALTLVEPEPSPMLPCEFRPQQYIEPLFTKAQPASPPASSMSLLLDDAKDDVALGMFPLVVQALDVVPLPSWPAVLSPQQYTESFCRMAHECT